MKNFAIAPEADELAEYQTEFQFHPSTTTRPRLLTKEQVEAYNRDGYLTKLSVFSAEEMTGQRAYFDDLLASVMAAGGDSYSISTAHLKYGPVYDLLAHPTIVGYVKDILGDQVVGWGTHYFCKMPGDGQEVAWHQDATYWPLSPTKSVTVWLAIDDSDVENGCMRVISGSHVLGRMKHAEATGQSVLDRTVDDPEQLGETVNIELNAGEVSIHSDQLVHGSLANNSNRRRCGLTLRYCTTDVRAGMDWNAKGVVLLGNDPAGHWANPSRPNT